MDVIGRHHFEVAPSTLISCTLLKGVLDDPSAPPPPTILHNLFLNLWDTIKGVFHHLPGQLPAKFQLGLGNVTLPSGPTVHCIHLGDRTLKSKRIAHHLVPQTSSNPIGS